MSKFFEALQQAERERALREQERRAGSSIPAVTPAEPAPPVDRPFRSTAPFAATERGDAGAPEAVDGVDEHLVSLLMPASLAAEQYRALRDLVEQAKQTLQLSIVGVSSALVRDGKTTTALNLAGALAQAPAARVLLVEADLRRPSIREYLGLDDVMGPGLVGLLGNPRLGLDDVVRPCSPFNFDILVAGESPAAAYELLKSPRLGEMLTAARRRYDYVVVDTPPILPAPDCKVIGRCVDGFLMVVAAHQTPRKMVDEALAAIEDGKLLGIVFNGDDRTAARYYAPHEMSADDRRPPWWNRLRADGPGGAERAPRGTRAR